MLFRSDKHCQVFLDNSARVSLLLRGQALNEAQEGGITAPLEILISRILQVHELLLLLPRETAQPQTSFVLRDCFGRRHPKISVVLTNFYTAYEYRFEDILKKSMYIRRSLSLWLKAVAFSVKRLPTKITPSPGRFWRMSTDMHLTTAN